MTAHFTILSVAMAIAEGTGLFILDSEGKPEACADAAVWAAWILVADRLIRLDVVENHTILTVFLGMDHSFGFSPDDPVLWTTVVFNQKGKERWSARYRTKAKALRSHRNLVKAIKDNKKLEGIER